MIVKNLTICRNISFDEYLKVPGFSYSWLKNEGRRFEPSTKMRLGSAVDAYLNEPEKFEGNLALIKPLARILKVKVGGLYDKFEKQLSITADFIHEGMVLRYKGRPDWCIIRALVIDLKVSENIKDTIDFFGYPNQLSGYALAIGAYAAQILSIDPVMRRGEHKVDLINIDITKEWWERRIIQYGEPLKETV